MELIDKLAIVAEIKRIEEQNPHIQHGDMLVNRDRSIRCNLLEDLLDFINNLEVKEVDLEKDFDKCSENYIFDDECDVYIARRFFELGLKAQRGE